MAGDAGEGGLPVDALAADGVAAFFGEFRELEDGFHGVGAVGRAAGLLAEDGEKISVLIDVRDRLERERGEVRAKRAVAEHRGERAG